MDYQDEAIEKVQRPKRITTPLEREILDPLINMFEKLTEELIEEACTKTGWDHESKVAGETK